MIRSKYVPLLILYIREFRNDGSCRCAAVRNGNADIHFRYDS